MRSYDYKQIEQKWQKVWEKEKLNTFNPKNTDKKYYCLEPEKLIQLAEDLNFKRVKKVIEVDEYFTDINSEYISYELVDDNVVIKTLSPYKKAHH